MDDSLLLNPVASRAEPTGLGLSAATALIIADNVGTGVFALPGQVAKLGRVAGLCALALMLVPNLGAALMLHRAAAIVERAAAPTGRAPSRSRARNSAIGGGGALSGWGRGPPTAGRTPSPSSWRSWRRRCPGASWPWDR